MSVIGKARKGKFMSGFEKCHIFLASKQEIHMNEFNIDNNNPIFKTIYQNTFKKIHMDSSTLTFPLL
jgi:hypothetical protein